MTERRPPFAERELETALVDLGARLDYPPTPPFARSVAARLRAEPARPRPLWRRLLASRDGWTRREQFAGPRRFGLALAMLAVLIVVVVAAVPSTRTAVADRLGLSGLTITHVEELPVPTMSPEAAVPPPTGEGLGLGERLTLDEAQARVGFRILAPTLPELGAPDAVYLGQPPPRGQVALVYRVRSGLPPIAGIEDVWSTRTASDGTRVPADESEVVGLLLTQVEGDLIPGSFGKGLAPGTNLEPVMVNGNPGFWIDGRLHIFFYRDAAGNTQVETIRLVGNTLVWESNGLMLRLESGLTRDEALRIAGSVR
jgi:hypothetical protein